MNFEKDDDDHYYDNHQPSEPPPINSPTEKMIKKKNIVECHDLLTIRKDNYVHFVTTNVTPCDNESKPLKKRETLPNFKIY